MVTKKEVRVYFADFWPQFDMNNNLFMNILKKSYSPILDSKYPDFVFHSCFSNTHLYYDAVKICYLGENLTPDFNVSDYAIGCDFLSFEDRYFRSPYYKFEMGEEVYEKHTLEFFIKEAESKKKFCNFIYSNSVFASPLRAEFFHKLNNYKKVDSGGSYLNNIGAKISDKRAWQREYKFSIAFENSFKRGYTTEKIYDALAAHTIPIYWGNPLIAKDFNPKRFINAHEFKDFSALIDYVKEVDNNDAKYLSIISEPWFKEDPPSMLSEDIELCAFIEAIISKGKDEARRTVVYGYTRPYVNRLIGNEKYSVLISIACKIEKILRKIKSLFK